VALEIQEGRAFGPRPAEELQLAASLEDPKTGGWGIQNIRYFGRIAPPSCPASQP